MRSLLTLAILVLTVSGSGAHDLYLSPAGDGFELVRGHSGAAEHEGASGPCTECPAGPAKFMLDDSSTRMSFPDDAWPLIPAPAGTAAAAVTLDWGTWARTPDRDVPRADVGDAEVLRLWRSRTLVKTIVSWRIELQVPLTEELEIVPVFDPFTVEEGQKLKVRVMMGRELVPGAVVCYDGDARGTTGPDGIINIRLRHGGLQLLTATVRRPDPSGELDEIVLESTLGFFKE